MRFHTFSYTNAFQTYQKDLFVEDFFASEDVTRTLQVHYHSNCNNDNQYAYLIRCKMEVEHLTQASHMIVT